MTMVILLPLAEWLAGERFRVTVLPNALPVITPEGFVPPWRFDRPTE